jgi:hypothetical protein
MSDPNPVPGLMTIPWYKSSIVQRLALSIVLQVLAVAHLSKYAVAAEIAPLVNDLLEVAGILFAAWAGHARLTKAVAPVALSKARAAAANVPPVSELATDAQTDPLEQTPEKLS